MKPHYAKRVEDVMKSSNRWVRNSRAVARTMTVLVLAVIIAGVSITPVLAKNDKEYHGRKVYHERRVYYGHGYQPRGAYYYPAPVYAPPPPVVYYAPPPPPPGITFVFPINIR
jgi:hypothetical protein